MTQAIQSMPPVLSGERREVHDPDAGVISYYVDGPAPPDQPAGSDPRPPLLLVHSINASASAHEVKPLFDAYRKTRRTYAIDLPGYGHSERSERTYDQRLMVDALHAVIAEIRSEHQGKPIDALAVSLSCEFIAKAAFEEPASIRRVALISPTGFARYASTKGPPHADCRRPGVLRFLSTPLLGKALFRLLSSGPSIRFFLRKTWGRKQIDEEMFQTSYRLSRYANAHRVPFHFIAGYLFSADIMPVYKQLTQPVWLSHGVRGDFTDYSRTEAVAKQPNWQITVFQTGALLYFEVLDEFTHSFDDFLDQVDNDQAVNRVTAAESPDPRISRTGETQT